MLYFQDIKIVASRIILLSSRKKCQVKYQLQLTLIFQGHFFYFYPHYPYFSPSFLLYIILPISYLIYIQKAVFINSPLDQDYYIYIQGELQKKYSLVSLKTISEKHNDQLSFLGKNPDTGLFWARIQILIRMKKSWFRKFTQSRAKLPLPPKSPKIAYFH